MNLNNALVRYICSKWLSAYYLLGEERDCLFSPTKDPLAALIVRIGLVLPERRTTVFLTGKMREGIFRDVFSKTLEDFWRLTDILNVIFFVLTVREIAD